MPAIFDRVFEREQLQRLIGDPEIISILVRGNSGAGKSVLIDSVLAGFSVREYRFSYKRSGETLGEFLSQAYKTLRPRIFSRWIKDVRFGTGISVAFAPHTDDDSPRLDEHLLAQILTAFANRGPSVLRVENVELAPHKDWDLISMLRTLPSSLVKIIIECGTLERTSSILASIPSSQSRHAEFPLQEFDSAKTDGFYRHIFTRPPPPDLFFKTKGLALSVEHYESVGQPCQNLEWVQGKMAGLTGSELKVALAVVVAGEPAPYDLLSKISGEDDFEAILIGLAEKRIVDHRQGGISFRHPAFGLYLRNRDYPYSTAERRRVLVDELLRNYRAGDIVTASRIIDLCKSTGQVEPARSLALELLPLAYERQDPLLTIFLCTAILQSPSDKKNRPQRCSASRPFAFSHAPTRPRIWRRTCRAKAERGYSRR